MKDLTLMVILLLVIAITSCSDCTNCEPFKEEPFLKIRFLNQSDSSKRRIIIDSVNQKYVKDIRHFMDTTFEYRFPLDMNNDTSVYEMVYREASDPTTYLNNRIELIYSRQFKSRNDNYLVVECYLEDYSSNFNSFQLFCKDNENKCLSNEAIAKVYN